MKKQIITNIMCFIIGGIVFGTIGVIAATAINSKDVSYTNTTSKLTSANVQAAVDELAGKLSIGNATAAQILSGKTAMVGGKSVTGTMTNWSSAQTAYTSAPSGKTNGQYCYYRINSGNIELIPSYGYYGTWDWTKSIKIPVPANTNSGTYTPTTRSASIDMGATNSYRYVNTNSVPNTNSGTYTYATGSTGGKVDLGATNTYRYVDATNVYNKGKADGGTSVTQIGTGNSSSSKTFNLSGYSGYGSFTIGKNIFISITSFAFIDCEVDASGSVSYNASTGVLTVPQGTYFSSNTYKSLYVNYTVYLVR